MEMALTKILLSIFALIITIQGAVIFRGDNVIYSYWNTKLPPSARVRCGEDYGIYRVIPGHVHAAHRVMISGSESSSSRELVQVSISFLAEPDEEYTFESDGKTYKIKLEGLVDEDYEHVWLVKYWVGNSKLGKNGVAKSHALADEVERTKQASSAFNNYLYIANDNEWMLLSFLEGLQTKAIPSVAPKPSECRTLFDTAREAATQFQKDLFAKAGFIQADRSADNFMYTDNTFESCKGLDFGLVDDLHEIEEKDRDEHIETFMTEIFEQAANKRCKKKTSGVGRFFDHLMGLFET